MVQIDRQQKCCILHDGPKSQLTLRATLRAALRAMLRATQVRCCPMTTSLWRQAVIAGSVRFAKLPGLQDDALHALKIQSMGVEHVTDGYRRVNGAMSAADPSIRDLPHSEPLSL